MYSKDKEYFRFHSCYIHDKMFSSLIRKVLLLSFPLEMSSCTHTRTHKVKPSEHTEEEVHWISKNSVLSCLINVAFLAHLLTPVCRCLPHPQRALLTGHLSGLWSSDEGTQPLESSSQRKTASSWSQSVGLSAAIAASGNKLSFPGCLPSHIAVWGTLDQGETWTRCSYWFALCVIIWGFLSCRMKNKVVNKLVKI